MRKDVRHGLRNLEINGNLWGSAPHPNSCRIHYSDGSVIERPPVGVCGNTTSSVSPSAIHLPLKGKAFVKRGSRSLCLPLEGKVAERSEVG